MSVVKAMNPTLWLFAGILIVWVLVQSGLFYRHTMAFNKRNNLLTKEEINDCMKVGAAAAVGPAMNAIAVALTLIAMVGYATTFMRCGVIGAPGWELYMANIAATTAGVALGSEGMTEAIFTFAIFCMVTASAPYFINCIIMLKPLDLAVEKARKGSGISYTNYMGNAAMFGMLSATIIDYFFQKDNCAALIVSTIAAIVVNAIVKKTGSKALSTFSMVICMIFGMIAGQVVFQNFMP
jgi:hypothetical protein